jgi:uncharacterized membrane protein
MILTILNKALLIVPGVTMFWMPSTYIMGYTLPLFKMIGVLAVFFALGLEFGLYKIVANTAYKASKEEKKAKKLDNKIKSLGL